jgi:hypothetical protein
MSEKTVVIAETDDGYLIQNNGISDFALIGILECILFDMKTAHHAAKQTQTVTESKEPVRESSLGGNLQREVTPEEKSEAASNTPDLRTRINNAVKAIKSLGGESEYTDLSTLVKNPRTGKMFHSFSFKQQFL